MRPEPERTGPSRAPVRPSTLERAAIVTNASPVDQFLGVAYEVFDQYLEEGRKFAEGRSAWYDGATAEQVANRVSTASPAEVSEVFAKLARDILGALDPARGPLGAVTSALPETPLAGVATPSTRARPNVAAPSTPRSSSTAERRGDLAASARAEPTTYRALSAPRHLPYVDDGDDEVVDTHVVSVAAPAPSAAPSSVRDAGSGGPEPNVNLQDTARAMSDV